MIRVGSESNDPFEYGHTELMVRGRCPKCNAHQWVNKEYVVFHDEWECEGQDNIRRTSNNYDLGCGHRSNAEDYVKACSVGRALCQE